MLCRHSAREYSLRGVRVTGQAWLTPNALRILKKGKFCAILMGDTRQKGCMVPMSFEVMRIFEQAGFRLKELIIKEQHNCRATGYWKTNSVKYNFLLIAHEYLFVFRK